MTDTPNEASSRPTPGALAAMISIAGVHALWTLFQWTQLVVARTGGDSFCGFGSAEETCSTVWNSSLASTVQGVSGMPVAGWGLVWSIVALALPLWVLTRRAAAAPPAESGRLAANAWPATLVVALTGLAVALGLLTFSLSSGHLCSTCAATYGLVLAYAAICFAQTRPWPRLLLRGVSLAAGATALVFTLLFIPGLRTPESQEVQSQRVLDQIAARRARGEPAPVPERPEQSPESTPKPAPAPERTPEPVPEPEPERARAPARQPTPAPARAPIAEQALNSVAQMLKELPENVRQAFSNELELYAKAPGVPIRPPRTLIGASDAPVRITAFTDVLCGHCAGLHETISRLRSALPPDAFSLEPRYFPLDFACNPLLQGPSSHPVRCTAARAEICLEDRPGYFDFAGSLYRNQQSLTDEMIFDLAEPLLSREKLAACIEAPATQTSLSEDIAWANEHDIEGTPLVLLNGRRVGAFGPLLYALIVTRGDAGNTVFDGLPEPIPPAPGAHRH